MRGGGGVTPTALLFKDAVNGREACIKALCLVNDGLCSRPSWFRVKTIISPRFMHYFVKALKKKQKR